jgi:hypothetical protein
MQSLGGKPQKKALLIKNQISPGPSYGLHISVALRERWRVFPNPGIIVQERFAGHSRADAACFLAMFAFLSISLKRWSINSLQTLKFIRESIGRLIKSAIQRCHE